MPKHLGLYLFTVACVSQVLYHGNNDNDIRRTGIRTVQLAAQARSTGLTGEDFQRGPHLVFE